jgi:hypothetical protein
VKYWAWLAIGKHANITKFLPYGKSMFSHAAYV